MSEFYAFAGEHPVLTFILAIIASSVICYPLKIVNRMIRHMNIRKAGWPPTHLDADGDWKEEE